MADVSVRPARESDVAALAEVQLRAWREAYAPGLPAGALAELDDAAAEAAWLAAVSAPPTPRHLVLVALADGRAVGLAALGPAEDDDLDPAEVAELYTLLVAPGETRQGHGSRLLSAVVDQLERTGAGLLVTWVFTADVAASEFFETAGWAPDGASRALDMGDLVPQLRLQTALGAA